MFRALRVENQYYAPKINRKDIVWNKRKYEDLVTQSQIDPCAELWAGLSESAKIRWNNAGAECGLNGYQLFVQDTSFRLLNNLRGLGSPSIYHQYKILEFETGDDCHEFYIIQEHLANYTIKQKNVGQKNAYTPVEIEEDITAPITLSFKYFADLEVDGVFDFFGCYITFYGVKDGHYASDSIWFDLDYSTGWVQFSEEMTPDLDIINQYYFEIDAYPLKGIFRMDDFKIEHDGQNWSFDSNCDRIDEKIIDYGDGWDYGWWLDWSGTYEYFGWNYI